MPPQSVEDIKISCIYHSRSLLREGYPLRTFYWYLEGYNCKVFRPSFLVVFVVFGRVNPPPCGSEANTQKALVFQRYHYKVQAVWNPIVVQWCHMDACGAHTKLPNSISISNNLSLKLFSLKSKLYTPSTLNNSNETYTFMGLGRVGRSGQS